MQLYGEEKSTNRTGGLIDMNSIIRIGVIGDYDGRPSHRATEEAIKHCAEYLKLSLEVQWISTASLEDGVEQKLIDFDGLWCAPGSPYQSMLGAVNGIQYAREFNVPFIGTCGGFQHAAIEYARNVLQIKEIQGKDFDPYSPNMFISALSCSLVGQTRHIVITENSMIHHIYGILETDEKFNCSFGLNREFQLKLIQNGLKVVGTDEEGEVRILVLEKNQFFVATLFQPQLSSTPDHPHPLILAYLTGAKEYSQGRKY